METDRTNLYALRPVEGGLAPAAPLATPGTESPRQISASGNPFRVVVDPVMRADLRRALFHLIDHHDEALAAYVAEGKLDLQSYKEYIELFARSLRETMESHEGVEYLLRSVGIETTGQEINLRPEWRWK